MKSDLLADLRAEVEAAALQEQAAIEAAKAARLREEAQQRAAEEAAREAEVAARLEAEARRKALLVEARAALQAPVEAPVPAQPAPASAAPAPVVVLAEPQIITAPSSATPWLAAAGVLMVCVTAIVVAVIWTSKPEPATPRVAAPPPPVLQVVDTPEIPGEAMILPTAHAFDTAPATEAPPAAEPKRPAQPVVGKGSKGGKGQPVRPVKPAEPEQLKLGDFMKAN